MRDTTTVLYTGKTRTTSGGRDGAARSSDGRLDIQLSSPGSKGAGTNPEQLFAAGWSACFIGAMGLAAAVSAKAGSAASAGRCWSRAILPTPTMPMRIGAIS